MRPGLHRLLRPLHRKYNSPRLNHNSKLQFNNQLKRNRHNSNQLGLADRRKKSQKNKKNLARFL